MSFGFPISSGDLDLHKSFWLPLLSRPRSGTIEICGGPRLVELGFRFAQDGRGARSLA